MGAAESPGSARPGGSPEGNRGTGTRTGPQPRAPACACQRTGLPAPGPSTMHLLGFLALACSLLAAALIPGPREAPATAAAFESGLGFSEAEPDGGEVKVGARTPPGWAEDPQRPVLDCGLGFAGCTENLQWRVCA